MNYELRLLQDELIATINSHDTLPWEARRLVVESIHNLLIKKADDEIMKERAVNQNAEIVQQN